MAEKLTDDPRELDGYQEWLEGAECPWFEIAPGLYANERTQETFRWRPGAPGTLTAARNPPEGRS